MIIEQLYNRFFMNDLKQPQSLPVQTAEQVVADTITDYEVRAEDSACINDSKLRHP